MGGNHSTELSAKKDPLIGRIFNDRFQVVSQLDRGGMAKVYLARQASLDRHIALKVLDPEYIGNSPDFLKRFYLEASACAKLTHPNTVTIYDYGATPDGVYYIAMELLRGQTLRQALRLAGFFSLERAVHITRQIARSAREAHRRRIVHRDLKPNNVFLVKRDDDPDFVKVLDFGLVKQVMPHAEEFSGTDSFLGTPKYMSPEQILGHKVDKRCDVYALGLMFFEMLVGRLPFAGSKADVIVAHVRDPVPRLSEACAHIDVPPEIDEVVQKCLAKKPDDRFASMDELLVALRELALRGGQLAFLGNDRSIGGRDRSESSCSFLRSDGSGSYSSSDLSSGALGRPSMFPGSVSPSEARRRAGERRKKRLLMATGVSAFALVLAASVILFSSDEGATDVGPAPTVALGPMNAAELSEPEELVQLKLRSTPRGASVVVDNSLICDATPCDVIWRGDEARSGRQVTFHFRLAGSKSVSVTKTIDSDNLAVSASLARLSERRSERKREARRPSLTARPPPPAPKPKPTPKKSAKSVKPNKIDDFKDNPY